MESIFQTIKKLLGVDAEFEGFDAEILSAINSALATLVQIGVGPEEGFTVTGYTQTWTDLLGESSNMGNVISLVHLKSRLLFDPPTTSFAINSMEGVIKEQEYRVATQVEINEGASE